MPQLFTPLPFLCPMNYQWYIKDLYMLSEKTWGRVGAELRSQMPQIGIFLLMILVTYKYPFFWHTELQGLTTQLNSLYKKKKNV